MEVSIAELVCEGYLPPSSQANFAPGPAPAIAAVYSRHAPSLAQLTVERISNNQQAVIG
jgi:hypothetical protein